MPKKSIFTKKQKRIRPKKAKEVAPQRPKQKRLNPIKLSINEASALSLQIQQMLDGVLEPAPPALREYLYRADTEVKDLIQVLTSKLGGTKSLDGLRVTGSVDDAMYWVDTVVDKFMASASVSDTDSMLDALFESKGEL